MGSSILDSEVCLPGFVIFQRDRDRHGGGMMVLVTENLIIHRCPNMETSCELLWIKLSTKKGPLLFGVYYHPPKKDVSMLQELNSSLHLLPANSKIACGDFNASHIDWSLVSPVISTPVSTQLCSTVNDNFLTQFVSVPTRHNHTLDLVFPIRPHILSDFVVVDNLLDTDHLALQFTVTLPSCYKSQYHRQLFNYSKTDFQIFRDTLSRVPWDTIIDYDSDIDTIWCQWRDLFLSVGDSCIPKVKWKRRKMKH